MKKKLLKIFFSILTIFILLCLIELSIWLYTNIKYESEWISFHPNPLGVKAEFDVKYFPQEKVNWGREVEGKEFTTKPLVLFGGDYVYGSNLKKEQTISHKLSKLTKRPVHNRALLNWGIQHMLYQTKSEALYKQIQEPEYIIYIYAHEDFNNLFYNYMSTYALLNQENNILYKYKGGGLEQVKNENTFKSYISNLYLSKILTLFYIKHFKLRTSTSNERYNFTLQHFIEARNETQKHWKNSKFVVLFYGEKNFDNLFRIKLEKENFIVITGKELTQDTNYDSNFKPWSLPNEEHWDILVPLLAEKLEIK